MVPSICFSVRTGWIPGLPVGARRRLRGVEGRWGPGAAPLHHPGILLHGMQIFLRQFSEEFGGVTVAVLNISGQAEMIGPTGQDATAAILAEQQKLRDDLLTGMLGRQASPPGEAANAQQLLPIIEHVGPPTQATL